MRDFLSEHGWRNIRRTWLWVAIGAAGLVMHAGTAVLRLSTFFPFPRLLDFSAFYASAWAMRQGLSPYNLPSDWLQGLQTSQAIPFVPPAVYNPPFWPWLLQPLTHFNFPVSASIWLVLNLALLVWITVVLADMARLGGLAVRVSLFLLVLTFGPVFLDLTLGQTSVVLLATALAIGWSLGCLAGTGAWGRRAASILAALAGGLAVGTKLFPLVWLAALPLLRRWRELAITGLLVVVVLGLGFAVSPDASRDYGQYVFTERLATASDVTSVDDQALIAWLDRLVRPQSFAVSGFGVDERTAVVWSPPWTVDAGAVRGVGYILLVLLLLPCLYLLLHVPRENQDAVFYLWVLYGLVALLHIERYNHVLLLPAMAWLWGRGGWQRKVVVVAYALAGLSRLTHLWAMLLPTPWGPLASGFGLYAVLALGVAIAIELWPSRWVRPVRRESTMAQGEVR